MTAPQSAAAATAASPVTCGAEVCVCADRLREAADLLEAQGAKVGS